MGRVEQAPLAGPSLEVLDDGGEELHNLILLTARELGDLVEELAHAADGTAGSRRCGLVGKEVFDADAESACELGDGVGARGLVALLPKGDVLLWLADEAG